MIVENYTDLRTEIVVMHPDKFTYSVHTSNLANKPNVRVQVCMRMYMRNNLSL